MNIRINQSTSSTSWYANRIGETIPVERAEIYRDASQGIPESVYWCREGGKYNCLNYVRFSDATETSGPAPDKPKPVCATWRIELNTECPFCHEFVDLLEYPDFWDGRKLDIPERRQGLDVTCPECRHNFEVDCEY